MMKYLFPLLCLPFLLWAEEKETLKAEYSFYLDNKGEEIKHGKIIMRYSNSKIYSEGYYVDGREVGEWNKWHKQGHKAEEVHYENGKRIKESKSWHENGQKASLITYDHGYKNGESFEWYDDGRLKLKTTYKVNKLHGDFSTWHANGQIKVQSFYDEGRIHGTYTEWNDKGVEVSRKFYKFGEEMRLQVHTEKYANGQLKLAYHFFRDKNGKEVKHGRFEKWFLNGEKWISCEYRFDQLHGTYAFGKRKGLNYREESYDHGNKHGRFYWYKEGKLTREELWQDNKMVHHKLYD